MITLWLVLQVALVQATLERRDTTEMKEFPTVEDFKFTPDKTLFDHRNSIDKIETVGRFDNVHWPLQGVIAMFNSSSESESNHVRKARDTSALGTRAKCTVSKEKLIGLKYEIKFALRNADATQGAVTCDIDSNNSDNCNEIMKLIQCGVNHMKKGYTEAIANGGSLGEITKWKNAYDDLLENYNKGIENANLTATQESKHKLDNLKTDLQILGYKLNLKIAELKKRVQELCSSEIHSGRINEAVDCFAKLNDYSKLPEVMEGSYDLLSNTEANDSRNKLKNVDKILKFIPNLPSVHQPAAYQSLYDSMLRNNHLDTFEALEFDNTIGERLENGRNMPAYLKASLSSLRKLLGTRVTNMLQFWARNKDYEKIKSYAGKSDSTKQRTNDNLPMIVKILYTNLSSFEAVLTFAYSLPTWTQTALGYKALLTEMQSHNHVYGHSEITKLAWKIKQGLDLNNSHSKDLFSSLKYQLPSSVREVIWSTDCFIKNARFNEYLYAASWWHKYDENYRNVFTWIPGGRRDEYKWRIETFDEGATFKIKIISLNEILFSANMRDDTSLLFRNIRDGVSDVFTYMSEERFLWSDQKNWKLEPTTSGNLMVRNSKTNYFLYAIDDHGDRRGIRVGRDPSNKDWTFYC